MQAEADDAGRGPPFPLCCAQFDASHSEFPVDFRGAALTQPAPRPLATRFRRADPVTAFAMAAEQLHHSQRGIWERSGSSHRSCFS